MRWKRNLYMFHRWVGLIVGLQLLAWSVGGFMFSILDIENVHGDLDREKQPPASIQFEQVVVTPAQANEAVVEAGILTDDSTQIMLRSRFDRPVYEFFDPEGIPLVAVDALTGQVIHQINEDQIRTIALQDFKPEAVIASLELLTEEPPSEFRGGPMPVYRVILDHPQEPHLYISPVTGEVLKRRNNPWRLFDFFWMLHIMDYDERKDFNHPLLTGMSLLAILTSATGLALWVWRIPRRKSRRSITQ